MTIQEVERQSGISTRKTLEHFAYRPSVILDGVGDIVKMAKGE